MQELIGQTLGQCKIIQQVGQGGMATVFKARQQGLDRIVAVKVLPPEYASRRGFSERFKREAQAIARLEHPHILPVYDYGQHGQYTYLVMRYIEGSRTLSDVMRQSLSYNEIVEYLKQIGSALDYAHQQNIVHRDIKPGNILLNDKWTFLADFGLVRLMEEAAAQLTMTGTSMGTPAYMSPEQSLGKPVDTRTDVYAVGAIAYQMFTGQIPHHAESSNAIIYRRNNEPAPSLRAINPEIPQPVDQSVQMALAPDPEARFSTTGAFVTALSQAVKQSNARDFKTTIMEAPAFRASSQPSSQSTGPKTTCPNCQATIPVGVVFCTSCGVSQAPQSRPISSSSRPVSSSASSTGSSSTPWIVIGAVGIVLLFVIFGLIIMFASGSGEPTAQSSNNPIVVKKTDTPTSTPTDTPPPTNTATPKQAGVDVLPSATPTKTPTPRPLGKKLINMSKLDEDDWELHSAVDMLFYSEDGELHFEWPNKNGMGWASPSDDHYLDFAVEVTGRSLEDNDEHSYGLMLRYEDEDNFYTAEVQGNNYAVGRMLDGDWDTLVDWTPSKALVKNAPNTIFVFVTGSDLTIYGNDIELAKISDDNLRSGQVGVYGSGLKGNHVVFSSFNLWALPGLKSIAPATPTPTPTPRPPTPKPVTQRASVSVNKGHNSTYYFGEQIEFCFSVSIPARADAYVYEPGRTHNLKSWSLLDGQDCFSGPVSTRGNNRVEIIVYNSNGTVSASDSVNFTVN